jgi:uncharacterized protein YdeI (YjbR/CyaY-like superfamily)
MRGKNIPKFSGHEEVMEFLWNTIHPFKEGIELIRKIILSSDKEITEHIKWKAPSFCYNGEDRITFNIRKNECIQLIFHRGAKIKDNTEFIFEEGKNFLEWLAPDRAVVKFYSVEEVKAKKAILKKIVSKWIKV